MAVKHERLKPLFGDALERFKETNIILFGVGGVGSFCLDCLHRSGFENITIVDFDSYDESNQNRQLWSEQHCGEVKVEALQQHYPNLNIINERISAEWVEQFDFSAYDIVLDAIDDIGAKVALAKKCAPKLISSMGSAKRVDPTKIVVDDFWKTKGDKLASKMRYMLRKEAFKGKFSAIFSLEEPQCVEKGSFMAVTAAFGLTMCAEAVKKTVSVD